MRLVSYRVISCDGLGGSIACAWNSQMASSLSQIHVACSTTKTSSFPLQTEKNIQAMKSYRFLQWRRTRHRRNPRGMATRLSPRTDQPTSPVFFSFLVEFHRDTGIEWRGILYPAYPVLLQSPTTHIPCILPRFWHTLSHARIYSSQKQNIVIPEMTSEANSSHSPLFLGREHGNVQNYKLWKVVEN